MFLRNLYEAKARRIVAIMPGGFHPFHPGHKSLYDWAAKTFGVENVYVAATADTKTRPFPFDVKKKLANMAGVPLEKFIQVKSPFNLNSYKDLLGDDAAIVFVRSQKDKNEQPLPDQTKKNGEPGYLRSYTGKNLNTADEMGYMAYGPTIDFDFSGMQIKSASELRATWPEMSDEDKLKAAKLLYGNGAPVAVKLLNQALGDTEAPVGEEQLDEWAPLVYAGAAAAKTVISWAVMRGAVPVLRWVLVRHGGKLVVGGTIGYYVKQGWDWVNSILGPEVTQFLIRNKFTIVMAVILILAGIKLKKFFEKKGDELVKKMDSEKESFKEDASPEEEDEFHRKLDVLVHKYFGHSSDEKPKKTKPKKKINEGYKLQLERDGDLMVLHIVDTASGKRTEVRGKSGYESGNYDPTDKLHQLLDRLGKSVDISQLMNGETVGINPKHPHGAKAKAATDVAYNESTDLDSLRKFVRSQREAPDQVLYQMMMAPDTYGHSASNFVRSWYERTKEENGLNDVDSALEIMVDELGLNENSIDDKTKGAIDKYQRTNTVGKTSRAFTDIEEEYLHIRELALKLMKNGLDAYTAYYKASEKMQFDPAMVFDWMGSEFKDEELEDYIPVEYERDWIKRAELGMSENFADGKVKGKSRPGRVKRSGASCNGSITALRKRAKNSSGEKARMYHWCANMKSGRKKK